jgi:hypothetical protein
MLMTMTSSTEGKHKMSDEQQPPPSDRAALRINEDWAATVVGLVLIVLILTGVITKGVLQ